MLFKALVLGGLFVWPAIRQKALACGGAVAAVSAPRWHGDALGMVWGCSPALWLSLVYGSLCDVLWSGDVLRAGDTWQERGFLLLQGKRRSTVWGCLLDVGMVCGLGAG
ncbi:MAG: hypothetical protein IJD16_07335 [Desulfovibrio sp.]|nr:hypothetical protein [Desulfovibrio sp.]